MSEMIERAVKAMDTAADTYLDNHAGCIWEDIPLEVFARAAIEAMREPTEEMIDSGHSKPNDFQHGRITVSEIYEAMIDAALSEKP